MRHKIRLLILIVLVAIGFTSCMSTRPNARGGCYMSSGMVGYR